MALDDVQRERLRAILSRCSGLRLALLFGSMATGKDTPRSDIDIAVAGEDIPVLDLTRELTLASGREVELTRLEGAPIPLLVELIAHSLPLYERDPGALARWRSHTLADLEIDLPWYQRMSAAFLRRVAERGI